MGYQPYNPFASPKLRRRRALFLSNSVGGVLSISEILSCVSLEAPRDRRHPRLDFGRPKVYLKGDQCGSWDVCGGLSG